MIAANGLTLLGVLLSWLGSLTIIQGKFCQDGALASVPPGVVTKMRKRAGYSGERLGKHINIR